MDGVDTVEKVFPEMPGSDPFVQIAIGGADKTDIHRNGMIAPHPGHLLALQDSQQLGLKMRRDIADFIEEKRPVVGQLELAFMILFGIGKSPLHITEQLALEQAFGQSPHVHAQHRLVPAKRQTMYFLGHHLLANPVRTGYQDIGIGRRHFFHQ